MASVKNDLVQAEQKLRRGGAGEQGGAAEDVGPGGAQQVADHPIAHAANEMAGRLSAEQPQERSRSWPDPAGRRRRQEAARGPARRHGKSGQTGGRRPCRKLAHHQDELARKMEQDPKDNANPQKEQALRQELQNILNKNQDLNNPQAGSSPTAPSSSWRCRVEDQERQAKQMDQPVAKQAPLKAAEQQAESLAQKTTGSTTRSPISRRRTRPTSRPPAPRAAGAAAGADRPAAGKGQAQRGVQQPAAVGQ